MAMNRHQPVYCRIFAFFPLLLLPLTGLATIFLFIESQAAVLQNQDDAEPVSLLSTLILDVRESPEMKYQLQITAPSKWEAIAGFLDHPSGSSTDAIKMAIQKLFIMTGIQRADVPLDSNWEWKKEDEGPGRISLLFIKTIPIVINKADEPKKSIELPGPFKANLENRELTISFEPYTIPSLFGITANVKMQGVDVNEPWRAISYGNYVDDAWFPGDVSAHVTWEIPAGDAQREGDSFSITLPCPFFQKIVSKSLNDQIENSIVLTSTIAMNASDLSRQSPLQSSTVEIKAPRDWPYVDGLRINEKQQSTNPKKLEAFLCTIMTLEKIDLAQVMRSGLITLSHFIVDDNNVFLTLSNQSGQIFFPEKPYSLKDILGQFTIEQNDQNLVILIGDQSYQYQPWVKREVTLTIAGVEVLSTYPLPISENGQGKFMWSINPESKLGVVEVVTTLPFTPLFRQLQISLGGWFWIVELLNDFLGLTVVLVIIWILSDQNKIIDKVFTPKVAYLKQILLDMVISLVGIRLVVPLLNLLYLTLLNKSMYFNFKIFNSLLSSIILLLSLLTLIVFINYTLQKPGHRNLFIASESRFNRIFNWILLGFIGFILVILNLAKDTTQFQDNLSFLLPLQGILLLIITIYLVTGLFRLFISFMPDESFITNKQPEQIWRKFRWIILLSSIVIFFQWIYVRTQNIGGWEQTNSVVSNLFNYPYEWTSQLLYLIPIVALVGIVSLLYQIGRGSLSPIFTNKELLVLRIACLLYAGFVINKTISLNGILLPLGLIIAYSVFPRLLSHKLKVVQEWIDSHNSTESYIDKPIMICYHRQLLERADEIEILEFKRGDLYTRYYKKEISKEDYNTQLDSLTSQIESQKYGDFDSMMTPPSESISESTKLKMSHPSDQQFSQTNKQELIQIPHNTTPKEIALSSGPHLNWWKNGYQALHFGLWLATLPVGYYLYIMFTERAKIILSSYSFGMISIIVSLIYETTFWLIAAFVLGVLFPYLWGKNGAIKGAFLAGIYTLVIGLSVLIQKFFTLEPNSDWLFRALQLFLYLIVLGILMDWKNLIKNNRYWRSLLDFYELKNARVLIGYLAPLVLTILSLFSLIQNGSASSSIITEILKSMNSVFLNIP